MAYLVPDLPRFVIPDHEVFWKWWDEATIPIKRLSKDSRGNGGGYDGEFWDGVTIWQKPNYQQNIVWQVNHKPNHDLFGEIIERAIHSLPWFDVHGITLWSNKRMVGPHQDGLPRDPFPSAPRIMLIDECHSRTFYLVHQKPFAMFHPDLRQGSNLFYFNNENFLHGTTAQTGGRKILARIDGPLVDVDGFTRHLKEQIEAGTMHAGLSNMVNS